MNNDTSIIYSTFALKNKLHILFTDILKEEEKTNIEHIVSYWKNCWFKKNEPINYTWSNLHLKYSVLTVDLICENSTSSNFCDKDALYEGLVDRYGLLYLLIYGKNTTNSSLRPSSVGVFGYLPLYSDDTVINTLLPNQTDPEKESEEFVFKLIGFLIKNHGLGIVMKSLSKYL